MKKGLIIALNLAFLAAAGCQSEQVKDNKIESVKMVKLQTSKGDIVLELYPDRAPVTVKNFLTYVNEGFYSGTIFHRVIPGFVIQGGGFSPDMKVKKTHEPIVNEASNGLSNLRGSIAMARTNDPDSATSQFYINLTDNRSLDYNPGSAGYTVFGKVVEGMDVVDMIADVPTGRQGQYSDVPREPVIIEKAQLLE